MHDIPLATATNQAQVLVCGMNGVGCFGPHLFSQMGLLLWPHLVCQYHNNCYILSYLIYRCRMVWSGHTTAIHGLARCLSPGCLLILRQRPGQGSFNLPACQVPTSLSNYTHDTLEVATHESWLRSWLRDDVRAVGCNSHGTELIFCNFFATFWKSANSEYSELILTQHAPPSTLEHPPSTELKNCHTAKICPELWTDLLVLRCCWTVLILLGWGLWIFMIQWPESQLSEFELLQMWCSNSKCILITQVYSDVGRFRTGSQSSRVSKCPRMQCNILPWTKATRVCSYPLISMST